MGQTVSKELKALGERVAAWRAQSGGRGSRIPDELWDEAVQVVRVDGLHATARASRFNYDRLKERCGPAASSEGAEKQTPAAVDETGVAPAGDHRRVERIGEQPGSRFIALGRPAPCLEASKLLVELVGRDGERMRVEMTGVVDVVGLVQKFWSRQ
jgi:hypothetical protein